MITFNDVVKFALAYRTLNTSSSRRFTFEADALTGFCRLFVHTVHSNGFVESHTNLISFYADIIDNKVRYTVY